jgi:hypothetical protein
VSTLFYAFLDREDCRSIFQPSASILSAVIKSSFLQVLESDEKSWALKIASNLMEDPHGI